MKRVFLPALVFSLALTCSLASAQKKAAPTAPAKPAAAQPSGANNGAALEKVLTTMDQAAAAFTSAQANFEWDQYSKIVDDHDMQSGTIYFRKGSKGLEMAADINKPNQKYVLFSEGNVQLYQPSVKQVTVYKAGKNRAAYESFLVLGFGGRGHDLPKQYDVKYAGTENVGGVNAAKLDLVPKQQSVKNIYSVITLWIDPASGMSVQQKFLDDKSGDYRLAKYSNIKRNEKISDSVFKLKTTPDTKTVSPQG